MDPITIGLLAAGGLLLYKGFTSGTVNAPPGGATPPSSSGGFLSTIFGPATPIPPLGGSGGHGPIAGQVTWPPNPGQPGFVTIGGQPMPASYSLGNLQTAIQASGVATSLAGGTLGIAGAVGGSAGAAGAIGATAATAIPIVGIGIAAVGLVLGIIAKHHAQAVQQEAAGLNQAVPVIKQRYVLILQAAIRGEINQAQTATLVQQAISDYYTMVKSITQGKWPYVVAPGTVIDNTVNTFTTGGKKPSTCNGPCEVGHDVIEPNGIQVQQTVAKILNGEHGTVIFQVVGAHAGFAGMPNIQVIY